MSSDSELKTGSFSGATGQVFELKLNSDSELKTGSFSDAVGTISGQSRMQFCEHTTGAKLQNKELIYVPN